MIILLLCLLLLGGVCCTTITELNEANVVLLPGISYKQVSEYYIVKGRIKNIGTVEALRPSVTVELYNTHHTRWEIKRVIPKHVLKVGEEVTWRVIFEDKDRFMHRWVDITKTQIYIEWEV